MEDQATEISNEIVETADAAPEPGKIRFKAGDQEVELTPEELAEYYEKGSKVKEHTRAAHLKFEEAAKERKAIEAERAKLKDVRSLLKDPELGKDLWAAVVEDLQAELSLADLTPEQRRIQELEQKLALEEETKEQRRKAEEEQEITREEAKLMEAFEKDSIAALETTYLPKDAYSIAEIATQVYLANQNEYDIPVAKAAELAFENLWDRARQSAARMPVEQLIKVLGKDTVAAIRKSEVEKKKAAVPSAPAPKMLKSAVYQPKEKPKKPYASLDDL